VDRAREEFRKAIDYVEEDRIKQDQIERQIAHPDCHRVEFAMPPSVSAPQDCQIEAAMRRQTRSLDNLIQLSNKLQSRRVDLESLTERP
jgi:hypothetical protein